MLEVFERQAHPGMKMKRRNSEKSASGINGILGLAERRQARPRPAILPDTNPAEAGRVIIWSS